MKLLETQYSSKQLLKETKQENLSISFSYTINNYEYGILNHLSEVLNDKIRIIGILKTILNLRDKTLIEFINTPKTSFAGVEKLNLNNFNFTSKTAENYIKRYDNKKLFIVRCKKEFGRIIGFIENNTFFVLCIEYYLGQIYKH